MKTRLVFRGSVIAICVLYGVWWNRGIMIPESDVSIFSGTEAQAIPKEENLGYALQSSGMEAITKQLQENEGALTRKHLKLFDFFSLSGVVEVDQVAKKHFLEQSGIVLGTGMRKALDLSRADYLSGSDFLSLHQKITKSGQLPAILQLIKEKEYFADTSRAFPPEQGANRHLSLQTFGRYLTIASLYLSSQGEYQEAFTYWTSAYLLGEKVGENNDQVFFLIGSVLQNNALLALEYMNKTFQLPQEIKESYRNFLQEHPIRAEQRYRNAVINDYWMIRNGISFFEQLAVDKRTFSSMIEMLVGQGSSSVFELIIPRTRLFDTEETKKILDRYFSLHLEHKEKTEKPLDPRCKYLNENTGMENMPFSFVGELRYFLQRKNPFGILYLCALLPRLKGGDTLALFTEFYQQTLLEQLQ